MYNVQYTSNTLYEYSNLYFNEASKYLFMYCVGIPRTGTS